MANKSLEQDIALRFLPERQIAVQLEEEEEERA